MAPKPPCAKYQYVVTSSGPKILPVDEPAAKDEESPADYNAGGYLPVKVNDTFKQGRYRIVRKLGWGHFSTVWLVKDTQKKTHSALKVVKSAGRYAETARDEIKLLSQVAAANPNHPGRAHIVSFLDSFSHQGPESSHVCIVFEPLGENLLALIERNKKKGVAKALVKTVAKQILSGLEYLHDECDLVHTDIKPENICKSRILHNSCAAKDPQLLPVQKKSDMKLEAELSAALSSSWKSNASISASWNDKLSSSLSSSYKSKCSPLKGSKPRSSNPYGHNRSQSGAITANWQDPGTAAPAPAVLVSAVVGSDSQGANILSVSNVNVVDDSTGAATSTLASETSSATATVRPSPTGTPFGPPSDKLSTDLSGANLSDAKPTGPIPSLLTQTAPAVRNAVTPSSLLHDVPPRASPPQQISQLSAHMHTHQASSLTSCSIAHQHCIHSHTTNPHSGRVPINSRATIPIPTTSHKPISPPPPPSSPATEYSASPSLAAFSPVEAVPPPASNPPITIKIADLGNATPSKKHYTEDIQTRQYRAPEAIVGRKDWDARADVWSVACVIFELLTAEYLFDPQGQGELFTKDDDHMAQIIELMGDFPLEVKMGGKYSRELFDHNGALRYIRTLKPWPLRRVMTEKYLYSDEDASNLCAFLEPMLAVDFRDRVHVRDMVNHPWLDVSSNEEAIEW
ncbi:CMGC/SRPK protein kinase [Ephemerocybe angulata]|uniref:non-specific serine/threonine protein kinase n=1 Tax=Ephemerocybe angulata TaxID=980116 RepID=A0A8H6IK60_9AGAR|nr:CMGC/SRPK protein kinase [Tulosesus angulatus]